MAYTDYDDLPYVIQTEELSRWGIPLSPTADRDAEILLHATNAQRLIDSTLARRYGGNLPFASPPAIIQFISLHLTIYYMASARQEVGEAYLRNYDNAIDLLTRFADGEIDIWNDIGEALLGEYDSNYGMETNTPHDPYDEDEDDYRVFPRTLLGEPPSTYEKTYREED